MPNEPQIPLDFLRYILLSGARLLQDVYDLVRSVAPATTRNRDPLLPGTETLDNLKDAAAADAGLGVFGQFLGDVLAPGPGELRAAAGLVPIPTTTRTTIPRRATPAKKAKARSVSTFTSHHGPT
jgi:hypothetical protein